MKARHSTMCCPIRLKTMARFLCRRSSRSNAQTAAWQESRSFIICSDFNYNKIVGSYLLNTKVMSNFGKCTVVIEGNAVKHVNDFLMPLCGKSDEYVCGKCFNVQSKLVDDVLYVNFESNWDLEILDKIIEICESESGRYYYNYYNESMLVDSESNDKEGKYFTKHEGYEKLLECDFVYYKPKFNFDNL